MQHQFQGATGGSVALTQNPATADPHQVRRDALNAVLNLSGARAAQHGEQPSWQRRNLSNILSA